jgi:hypothetical protein
MKTTVLAESSNILYFQVSLYTLWQSADTCQVIIKKKDHMKVWITQKQEKKEKTLTEKMKSLRKKGTHKHMEASFSGWKLTVEIYNVIIFIYQ